VVQKPGNHRPTASSRRDALRGLPAVGAALASRPFSPVVRRHGAPLATALLRESLADLRADAAAGRLSRAEVRRRATTAHLARDVDGRANALLAPAPRVVVNATGVVIHTNLGRAPLSGAAAAALAASARCYVDLEYDLSRGRRGSRMTHIEPLVERMFPGCAALVVNNNAAAIMVCLRALARGREVILSRGELVEIGDSFRVPEILSASGARLREVGTTNRTRLADYEAALSSRTGSILKVHTSNFRIVGYTQATSVEQLAGLARRAGVPLVVDWGSGDLVDLGPLGIHDELPAKTILDHGADLVTFSGDKLLGGPQAGFVVGRRELVEKIRRDPLARVCRPDRMLVGAVRATLASYLTGRAFEEVPTLRMLALEPGEIDRRARRVEREVARATGAGRLLARVDGVSRTGGGSSPAGERPTRLLAVEAPDGDAAGLERRLRDGDPPVVARVKDGRLLLDLRTVLPEQDAVLAARLAAALGAERSRPRARRVRR